MILQSDWGRVGTGFQGIWQGKKWGEDREFREMGNWRAFWEWCGNLVQWKLVGI